MLSAHPSSYWPHHTHTHTHTHTNTHTHRVPADPTHPSKLKKLLFLFYFQTCQDMCSKHFPNCNQFRSMVSQFWLSETLLSAAHQASLSITNSQNLLKLMSIESVMPSNHLTLCRPILLPSIFPSIRVFSKEPVLHIRWPKYWSFSFSISLSNEKLNTIKKLITSILLTLLQLLKIYAAAAAKLLQSCPTLCDPRDGSPPGSPVLGILQGKNTGVGCHFLLQCMKVKSESEVAQSDS